jgi:hypothetical protein
MDVEQLDRWFPPALRQPIVARLVKRVGLTRIRAEYFLRLWVYLLVKEQGSQLKPPLQELQPLTAPVICSLSEVSELFYSDQDQGSDRAAGMMLVKLAALGLIDKQFDGNTTQINIVPIPELLTVAPALEAVTIDPFDPRCDAIPVANLLAQNYNWMNRNQDTVPHRIVQLLRRWAGQYAGGMRVLRRCDNRNPVGFYLLYPTDSASESNFFSSPSKGLHLSSMEAIDPFGMATIGDPSCVSVFVRSWMIDPQYLERHRRLFLSDVQQTLRRMQLDFPNLCDLHTLIIHPGYEEMAAQLGFQKTIQDAKTSVYWMYLPLDRFLERSLEGETGDDRRVGL